MSALDVFTYADSHPVRTVVIDGEPWFVAADVARILGYREAYYLTRMLDDDEKGPHIVRTPGGDQSMTIISESGLYVGILSSRVEGAREFKRWVTRDVLPALRKTGRYGSDAAMLAALPSSELLLMAAEAAKQAEQATARAELAEARIEEDRPKVEAYDAFMDAEGYYPMDAAARILGYGRNTLFRILRDEGILQRGSNLPYRQYDHHFVITPSTWRDKYDVEHTTYTTRVRPSGLDFLRKRLGALAPN